MIVDWNKETVRREGYFQALLDVKNWFDNHSMSLKRDRMYNQNGIQQILSVMADNADYMYEKGSEIDMYFSKSQKKLVAWRGNINRNYSELEDVKSI